VPERFPPEHPREWLNRATSALALAKARADDVYLEDLCYQAQQAVEKAIKALLIHRGAEFSYVHDIGQLLTELEWAGEEIPEEVRRAERLTRFAVFTRYPVPAPPVTPSEWAEAVALAERVVNWAGSKVSGGEE